MDFLFAFAVAVSLSMDAFAVSVSCGITVSDFRFRHTLKVGLYFGLFQLGMPIIGYYLGIGVRNLIESYDHWIAFVMLAFIGGKMICDGVADKKEDAESCCAKAKLSTGRLLILAVATSIDALIIGITIALTGKEIFLTSAIIGAVCFVFSVCGGMLGRFLGKTFSKYATVIGGVILVAIGLKTLVEHLTV